MKTPASIGEHPLHPMLITIPVGLWLFSVVCDGISFMVQDPGVWHLVAFYCIAGGLVGALAAAIPGVIDLSSLKDPHIKRIALWHMGINFAVVALFAISTGLRVSEGPPPFIAMVLSVIGIALLGLSGWLGAEMVHVHRVGVLEHGTVESDRQINEPATGRPRDKHQHKPLIDF